jgi:hypothetical protein
MDEKKKKDLIKKLSGEKDFDKDYSAANRRWFVDKLIRVFEAQGQSDAQIEQKTATTIRDAKTVVKAKRDFRIGFRTEEKFARTNRKRRVEILYGAIAHHPEFTTSANAKFLDYIARRRYRTIARMELFVNPNSRGFFRYPETCPADQRWRVNVDANGHWDRVAGSKTGLPQTIKPQAGGDVDPVASINKLYVSKKDPCKGNLFDCAVTLSIIFMDSLQESRKPNDLLKALHGRGNPYLSIIHINIGSHFLTDNSANSMFEKLHHPPEDIQIGDHVYIFNHPLYKLFNPTGSWRGEHSLLANCGNRKVESEDGLVFVGHGMVGTVHKFYNKLLLELQTLLYRAYRIGKLFLEYKRTNGSSQPASKVSFSDHVLTDPGGGTRNARLYHFDIDFKFNDYQKTPTRQNKKPQRTEHGFVIVHLTSENKFGIHEKKSIADALADQPLVNIIPFDRVPHDPGEELYDAAYWSIFYPDPTTGIITHFPVFNVHRNTVVIRQVTLKDLFNVPFAKADPAATGAHMTRPRVDFGSAYQSFLTTNGAL